MTLSKARRIKSIWMKLSLESSIKTCDHSIIGTKCIFTNKFDEHGVLVKNKGQLVAKGYNQSKGIDFNETYALVARLEVVRILST